MAAQVRVYAQPRARVRDDSPPVPASEFERILARARKVRDREAKKAAA